MDCGFQNDPFFLCHMSDTATYRIGNWDQDRRQFSCFLDTWVPVDNQDMAACQGDKYFFYTNRIFFVFDFVSLRAGNITYPIVL